MARAILGHHTPCVKDESQGAKVPLCYRDGLAVHIVTAAQRYVTDIALRHASKGIDNWLKICYVTRNTTYPRQDIQSLTVRSSSSAKLARGLGARLLYDHVKDVIMDDVLVLMAGIEKSFPGVHALTQGHFELRPGEVHALCGENGAGKSTLMKVLAGIYKKDAGRIVYKGQEVEIPSPRAALHLGISIIHQELNLMPHLTVAQNIFIGREPRKSLRFLVDEPAINQQTRELFDMMHLKLDPRAKVADLTVAKQQMVEIAKALSFNSEVLIMDEPTAALTDTEIDDLFRIIRQLREKGVGIVYISHRMDEIKRITDRVTVMRDSR